MTEPETTGERPRTRLTPSPLAELRVAVLATLGIAALGIPAAALWYGLAPRAVERVVAAGRAVPIDAETKAFIAADGYYLVITGVAGVICGGLAFALGRRYSLGLTVALGLGGSAAALITWRLGVAFASGGFHDTLRTASKGAVVDGPLGLGATGALIAWPLAALVVMTVGVAYLSTAEAGGGGRRRADRQPDDAVGGEAAEFAASPPDQPA